MKRLTSRALAVSTAMAVLAAAALVVTGRGGSRAGEGGPPEGHFRVSVDHVVRDPNAIVVRIDVQARPRSHVRVFCDQQNKGGVTVNVSPPSGRGRVVDPVRLTVLGDHIRSKVDGVKLLLRSEHAGGATTGSEEGPMPAKANDLKDLLTVTARPGVYAEGKVVELYRYDGRAYSLDVERIGSDLAP